jgi:hypothetical protein
VKKINRQELPCAMRHSRQSSLTFADVATGKAVTALPSAEASLKSEISNLRFEIGDAMQRLRCDCPPNGLESPSVIDRQIAA